MRTILKLIIVAFILIGAACSKNTPSPQGAITGEGDTAKTSKKTAVSSLRHGKILYQFYCAGCHGDNGYGDGSELLGDESHVPNLISLLKTKNEPPTTKKKDVVCTSDWSKIQNNNNFNNQELYDVSTYVRSLLQKPMLFNSEIKKKESLRAKY